MRFWKKRAKPENEWADTKPGEPPAPKVLTGIEKMELEQREALAAARQKKEQAIREQISAIENKIAPDLQQLTHLRAQLAPEFGSLAYYQNTAYRLAAQSGLSGGIGRLGGLLG